MGAESENSPLMGDRPDGHSVEKGGPPRRSWHKTWLEMCGACDGHGWGICCLTYFCPAITFGLIKFRASGSQAAAILWGLFFALCIYTPSIVSFVWYMQLINEINDDIYKNETTHFENSEQADDQVASEVHELQEQANTVWLATMVLAVVGSLVITVAGFVNRIQMRKKFSIRSTDCGCHGEVEDACLWLFCKDCALCQEARTLTYNNVEEGVWNGPSTMGVHYPTPPPPTDFGTAGTVVVPVQYAQVPAEQCMNDGAAKV